MDSKPLRLASNSPWRAATALVNWPTDKKLNALINGLGEVNKELGEELESRILQLVSRTFDAAFQAGFAAGRHPEKLIFEADPGGAYEGEP